MEPHSLTGAYSDGGSQVLWEDGERVFHRGWRPDDNGKRAVLLVMPAADQPSRSSLDTSPTNTSSWTSSTAHGRCGIWSSCAAPAGPYWCSTMREASRSIGCSAPPCSDAATLDLLEDLLSRSELRNLGRRGSPG